MARHDCPNCERPRVTTIREGVMLCATCGERVERENIEDPEALTEREDDALAAEPPTEEE